MTRIGNQMVQKEELPAQEERRRILEHARLVLARSRALAESLDRTGFVLPRHAGRGESNLRHDQQMVLALESSIQEGRPGIPGIRAPEHFGQPELNASEICAPEWPAAI